MRYEPHRSPEDLDHAWRLDSLLGDLWQDHPHYVKLPGTADIEDKLAANMRLIAQTWKQS